MIHAFRRTAIAMTILGLCAGSTAAQTPTVKLAT